MASASASTYMGARIIAGARDKRVLCGYQFGGPEQVFEANRLRWIVSKSFCFPSHLASTPDGVNEL